MFLLIGNMTLPDGVVSIIKIIRKKPLLTLFCVLPSKYFILLRRMKNTTQVHTPTARTRCLKENSFLCLFPTMNLSLFSFLFAFFFAIQLFLLEIYLHFYYIFVVKETCVYMCFYLYSCVCVMIFQFEIKHKT